MITLRDVMIDIETLSSEQDAAVIAIGMAYFDNDQILATAEFLIDPRYAIGDRNPNTLSWWREQDFYVFNTMMSGHILPWEACDRMDQIIREWNPRAAWANPPSFDMNLLRRMYSKCGKEFPIHFSNERCFRTFKKLADELGISYREEAYANRVEHDAVSDAVAQAKATQIIAASLGKVSV